MVKKFKKNEKPKKKENKEDKKEDNIYKDNESKDEEESLKHKDLSKLIEKDLKNGKIINKKSDKSNNSIYKILQNDYLKNNLNINIISMITKLINTSSSLPNKLKSNYPLNNLLIEIVKEFMLSDLEIVYLSLYLDIYGWENKFFDIKDNLILTALSVKKYLNEDIDIIETHLNENYENMNDKFINWIKSQNNKNKIIITPRMVNERNNILKKSFNCYCRNNYIDYDDAVDKILNLSLSYNEINKHSNKSKSKEETKQIIDFTKEEENNY
jgi:hypothetical protein